MQDALSNVVSFDPVRTFIRRLIFAQRRDGDSDKNTYYFDSDLETTKFNKDSTLKF